MEFQEIINQINRNAVENHHLFGTIQHIREKNTGKRTGTVLPFGGRGIKAKENYAFHNGARKELQFNLGEDSLDGKFIFRYGVAFGLQQDRTLHNSEAHFKPLIKRFNIFLNENSGFFEGMTMWYYSNKKFTRHFDHVIPIGDDLIKTNHFIFIGKYIEKTVEEIKESDIHPILETFDYLFPLYLFVQNFSDLREKRTARICWNENGWKAPSGLRGKSTSRRTHEGMYGYGHEEWLFDFNKIIDGKMAGFLQPIRDHLDSYVNKTFDVWLYTLDGETDKRYWVGELPVEVITKEKSDEIRSIYQKNGWLNAMEQQIVVSGANATGFSDFKGVDMFNIIYDPSMLRLNDPMVEIPAGHPVYKIQRYNFNKYTDAYFLEPVNKETPFSYIRPALVNGQVVPGQSDPKKSVYRRKPSDVEIELLHNAISESLTSHLREIYGYESVHPEHPAGHSTTEIDIVVNDANEYYFYEIKTYSLLRACIREALGQLFEYNFWTRSSKAKKLIVVTQPLPDLEEAKVYFSHLRNTFGLPVFYQTYNYRKKELSELY